MRAPLLALPLLLALSFLSTGCALFEPTVVHEAGMVSRSRQYELSPEHLAATPMLNEELTGVQFDEQGRIVAADSISRSWGIPPAPRELYFAASEELADSETDLRQDSNWTGTGVSATRAQVGNADTATIAGQTQAARTQASADLVDSIIDKAGGYWVQGIQVQAQRDIEIEKIGAQKEVDLASLHSEEPAAEPEPEPEVTP